MCLIAGAADELNRSDLWNFQYGVAGRSAAPIGTSGVKFNGTDLLGAPLPHGAVSLPRITHPYNTLEQPGGRDLYAGLDD